jgi:NADPH-dependent 2,4-dienoyl-CoA reductase/sulfur reductase-like enzyme
LRLLLDEHYSPLIAEQLRERGHEVVAIVERPDLTGRSDGELLSLMAAERRAILTENWSDFQRELQSAAAEDRTHYGIVFTSRRQLPRGKGTIGLYADVLDDFLGRHEADDGLLDSYRWLPDG